MSQSDGGQELCSIYFKFLHNIIFHVPCFDLRLIIRNLTSILRPEHMVNRISLHTMYSEHFQGAWSKVAMGKKNYVDRKRRLKKENSLRLVINNIFLMILSKED